MAGRDGDPFAAAKTLMTLAEALKLLRERARPIAGIEKIGLRESLHRVLAEDLVARRDIPAADNSAVDGYAVHHEDLAAAGETRLPVIGRIAAGRPLEIPPRRGGAYRIFTGAVLPPGLDSVIMQEAIRTEGEAVVLPPGVRPGANRRMAGEDIRAGTTVIASGTLLRPQELGVAAALGRAALFVRRRLKAAVFSTGDEVVAPGKELPPGGVYDANRFSVTAILESWGCAVTDLGILPDRPGALRDALAEAAQGHDVLVTSGGVSVGEEDHVKAAIASLGSIHLWRLAIKPGRPIAFGHVGEAAFVGLPGNPVAAIVTCLRVARPFILSAAGRRDVAPRLFAVRAGFAVAKKAGRREWLRARLEEGEDGFPVARKFAVEGSAILSSMISADGLVELPEDCAGVEPGTLVPFLPFAEVMW